jgi:hypothetical protein
MMLRTKVRTIAIASIFFASVVNAGPRDWKPATVVSMDASDDEIVKPRSHMVKDPNCQGGAGCYHSEPLDPVHIETTILLYQFETADTIYKARHVIRKNGKGLDVTLHGQTKVATDGMTLHVLDDDGKDQKLTIVEKIAK